MKDKKKIPGPCSYNPQKIKSKKNLYASKAYAGNAFIDEAVWKGQETPGLQKVKYVTTSNI